ncbi:hypothetical protein OJ997_27450 [Solirubrobacter phytolaccae]|uniref:Uncharacterized protein n=1 Tax=Solirubrobacter phytolaccae TaxID=1404360 RepID=A0A9X3NCC4_9ACTN|nr:hypothetical protein [Solirubrobacter phytolaccae]MDA0184075.1 hypothetical protein [Solirubrobacter phytolaccae]
MRRVTWVLVVLLLIAVLPLRWLLESVGVPRGPAAGAAGLALWSVGIVVLVALERRRRGTSSDRTSLAEHAGPPR